jgi:hypothetical protein
MTTYLSFTNVTYNMKSYLNVSYILLGHGVYSYLFICVLNYVFILAIVG